jgi:spermidine synthase
VRHATALLFVSGATALVYEVVWGKWLANLLGNSGQAHAVVLATFLFGLALGAWVFGRRADRSPRPLRLYAVLEAGIAAYALAFPFVLDLLGAVYLRLGGGLFSRLLLAGLAVLPPTVLMGGTLLPVVRHLTAHVFGVRDALARLYAVNALGAAFGALAGGMVLVPALGLSRTTWLAAALNLTVAVAAWVLSQRQAPAAAPQTPASGGEPEYGPGAVKAARFGAALSGFASMALQVAWIRVLTLVLGASTYAFTLILTAFILGIGLGSLLLPRVRQRDALRVFGAAQLLLAVAVGAALLLYARLPYWMWQLSRAVAHTPENWPLFQALSFLLCAGLLLIPTTLLGASFPAVARVGAGQERALGERLGGVYLWNTAGAVTGALLCGLWLMPALTVAACVAAALGASVLAGAVALWAAPSLEGARLKALGAMAASAAAAWLCFTQASDWPRVLANAGTFRETGAPPDSFEAFRARTLESDIELLRRDDTFATVVVGTNKVSNTTFLRLNGKVDASDDDDLSTQILLGQLGPLLHPRGVKTALVIGLGSGVTVGSLLTHGVDRVDVVEISPAVVVGAGHFTAANRAALEDRRVHVIVDDARTWLAQNKRKYDVIISEPSNPWVAGVAGLYTREFFRLAREHLAPGGLLVQWQHLYETDPELVRLVLRTLRDTFPHGTSWLGGLDLLMVAGVDEVKPDPARLEELLKSWPVGSDLGRIRAHTVPALLALQVHSDEGQRELAGEGPVNTDDHNLLEFQAPRAFFLQRPKVDVRDERAVPGLSPRLALAKWKDERAVTPDQLAAIHASMLRASSLDAPAVVASANAWLATAPDDPRAKDAVAASAMAQGNPALAVDLLREAVAGGALSPGTVARFADAVAKLEAKDNAVWAGTPSVLSVVKAALFQNPEAPALLQAADRFCRGQAREACLSSVDAFVPPER